MEYYNASLIANNHFWLGKSQRNLHSYVPLETAGITLGDRTLVEKSKVVKMNKQLLDECQYFNLPIIFAECLGQYAESTAVLSGRRALYLPKKYIMNLKDLGWSSQDVMQEFVVDVKGSGIRLCDSEQVSKEQFKKFAMQHGIKRFTNNFSDNQLVFSRNRYISFESPEGAQRQGNLYPAVNTFHYFSSKGFKLAPVICGITYPKEVQRLAREFDARPIKITLGQEKRLMPSFVRATYFEHNSGREQELLKLISSDRKVLENLEQILTCDMKPYLQTLASDTFNKKGVYSWSHLGDVDRLFDNPDSLYEKNYSWFLAKDIVIAPSGMYFVDMDSGHMVNQTASKEELMSQQQVYLTSALKDFFRLSANYGLALRKPSTREAKRKIEADSRKRVIDALNECDNVKIKDLTNSLTIKLNSRNIGELNYIIDKVHLPLVVEN